MARQKIDINQVTPGWDVRELNQFDYMEIVYRSPLETMGKLLLGYYAFRYNFKKGRGAYAGVKRTARDLGISTSTVNKWKKYLRQHQWIEVKRRGEKETDVIFVSIGFPDPKIETPAYLASEWEDWNEFLKDNRSFPKVVIANDISRKPQFEEIYLIDDEFETKAALQDVPVAM
jgi:hypothetical protein